MMTRISNVDLLPMNDYLKELEMADDIARINQILEIFQRMNWPVIIKFKDGDYTVRPDRVGDTIFGASAHKAMYAMHRAFNYHEPTMAIKVKFIFNFKNQ